MGSGGRSQTTTPPSESDLVNARIVSELGPLLFKNMGAGMAGVPTADSAGSLDSKIRQSIGGASAKGIGPGTSQLFSMVDGMAQPGSTKKAADIMMLLYGKQPSNGPMGQDVTQTPGALDWMNTALKGATIAQKFNQPGPQNTPTVNNYGGSTGGGGGYMPQELPKYF